MNASRRHQQESEGNHKGVWESKEVADMYKEPPLLISYKLLKLGRDCGQVDVPNEPHPECPCAWRSSGPCLPAWTFHRWSQVCTEWQFTSGMKYSAHASILCLSVHVFFPLFSCLYKNLATKPYYRLGKVLETKCLLKDISKLSPLHQPSNVEVFYSVKVVKFAPNTRDRRRQMPLLTMCPCSVVKRRSPSTSGWRRMNFYCETGLLKDPMTLTTFFN